MNRIKPVLALLCVVAFLVPTGAHAVVDPLAIGIHTVWRAPDGTFVPTDADGHLLVPAVVDVDHSAATGVAGNDIAVLATPAAVGVTLRVANLHVTGGLPVSVEVTLADPRSGATDRIALGFDGLADTIPLITQETFTVSATGAGAGFSVDLETIAPGKTIGLTAAIYTPGANGARLDPQSGRLDLTPVPPAVQAQITTSSSPASVGVSFVSPVATKAALSLSSVQGSDASTLAAVFDKLPTTLSFTLAQNGAGESATYTASDRVGKIQMQFRQTSGSAIVRDALLDVTDMPKSVTFKQDSQTHSSLKADTAIGRLVVGVADGGAARFLPDAQPYIYLDDRGGVDSVALQIDGLSSFDVSMGEPTTMQISLAPGPLHVLRYMGSSTLQAWVRDMPSDVTLTYSPKNGSISYRGSDVINDLTLDETDPAGISGRATALHVHLRGVPTSIDLQYSQTNGTTSFDAGDGQLGLIEVQLTSGPDERLGPQYDGVLVRDLPDRYVVFARFSGLRSVKLVQGSSPDLSVDTVGGRVLAIDLNKMNGAKLEYIRAQLNLLVPHLHIQLKQGSNQEIFYDADSKTNSITFDTNVGDRWNLHAQMSPVPASVHFCAAPDGFCTGYKRTARAGSYSYDATQHTNLYILDCVRPLDASCPSAPQRYTYVNLNLRHFDADADFDSLGFSGHIYLNTNKDNSNYTMTGNIQSITSSDGGFSAGFGSGFWAHDRKNEWSFWGLSQTKTGSINCTSGTYLSVRVFGFWLGITGFLC